MSRFPAFRSLLRAALPGALLLLAALPAMALDRGAYSLEILVDGLPLAEYAARNTTYVEALRQREYSVRLSNHTPRRIAVALAVDGLNSIDAKHGSAQDATKWVLGPHQTIVIDGWQTNSSTARRFYFTAEDDSYGNWLGDTRNLGIVSAAVFREKLTRPAPITRQRPGKAGRRSDASGPAPAEEGSAGADMRRESRSRQQSLGELAPEPDDESAATGIGREVDHRVRRVRFEAEASPAAVIQVRYEYHDALVRLGVLPRPYARRNDPLERRERASGFDGLAFAPDPYRRPRP